MTNQSIVTINQDPDLQKFIKKALENDSVTVHPAKHTLQETYALYNENPFQLIVLDMFMKNIPCLEAIKAIKKFNEALQIVLIARISSRSLNERAFRFGVSDILVYPCPMQTLRHTILHRLENYKEQEIHFG